MTSSGSKYLTLNFTRNTAATDITLVVQGNASLNSADWSTVATYSGGAWSPAANVTESGTGPTVNVQVRDSVPEGGLNLSRFLRLLFLH